jgi:hypothetical protein
MADGNPFPSGDGQGGEDEVAALLKEQGPDSNGFLESLNARELDVGEKADDAVDYGDIELSEEEDDDLFGEGASGPGGDSGHGLSGTTMHDSADTVENDGLDDLFGGGDDNDSPADMSFQDNMPLVSIEDQMQDQAGADLAEDDELALDSAFRDVDYGAHPAEEDDPEVALQLALFAAARGGGGLPPAPTTSKEVFEQIWPNFEPDKPPRFASLMPKKLAYFVPKKPLKQPKSLTFITKVNLDIAPDQEKAFRLPDTSDSTRAARQSEDEQAGIVYIAPGTGAEQEVNSDDEMDIEDFDAVNEQENIGAVSWGDLLIACEDWDAWEKDTVATISDEELHTPPDVDMLASPNKKRRLGERDNTIAFSVYDHMGLPSWDDPELATAKLSKKIVLDMNDPHLLLDVQQPSAESQKSRTTGLGLKRDNRGSLANPMFKRYNISNDEAYDALKESSQQKIRGTIGHMNIEHSLPALKLQYPFYKVNLSDRELRSFHRPTINFKIGERASVTTLKSIKKKTKRHLKPSEAFAVAEDLTVGDNSEVLLAEYSEEYPTTLSNFGMGVKIINYYRRSNPDDNFRPKAPIGETSVLLMQDKSPFSVFGEVEKGQECLTLHNAMYRAPIFQHDAPKTDFLVSRSTTGVGGSKYYMRNIDNLVVVGQEFPSVEVPGTHARKVTEASKKRLKMLGFRLYRRGQQRNLKQPWVSNDIIKYHLPGTEIAQNRSRMREIMKYEKDKGTWEPKEGEVIPDEPTLRTWIKPEDICLIDSMHAGDKQLLDAGIKTNEIVPTQEKDEDGDNEQLELKLAPWNTTKNFLNACTGKAMLQIRGAGDPTGKDLGFSFLKVSMKGGFKDDGASVADKIDARNAKENGGHSYNVQQQQQAYETVIKRTWNAQKESLSSRELPSEDEPDVDAPRPSYLARGRSEAATPAGHREDETMSQFSRNSEREQKGKKLKITRMIQNKYGEMEETVTIVTDPEVIKLYCRRKREQQLQSMSIDDIKPTGDSELDKQQMLKLKQEMARLQRNIERREGREKAKGVHRSQTGEGGTPVGKGGSTPRKCANCGEVGHIKTNKKLCPLLNGQKKQSDTFKDAGAASVPATPIAATPTAAGSPTAPI